MDGGIGTVIGGFEPAVGTALRVWLVMEAAVGERPAEALVEEQEEQGHRKAPLSPRFGLSIPWSGKRNFVGRDWRAISGAECLRVQIGPAAQKAAAWDDAGPI